MINTNRKSFTRSNRVNFEDLELLEKPDRANFLNESPYVGIPFDQQRLNQYQCWGRAYPFQGSATHGGWVPALTIFETLYMQNRQILHGHQTETRLVSKSPPRPGPECRGWGQKLL